MTTLLTMLRWGLVGITALSGLIIIFLAANLFVFLLQISSSSELEADFIYSIGDGPEKSIALSSDEFPDEDLDLLVEKGKIEGKIQVLNDNNSVLMSLNLMCRAPLNDVKEAVFDVALEAAGRELATEALGEDAHMTIEEALASPPEELANFLGEDYEEVIMDLSGGDLDMTLEEMISEDLDEKVERLPEETLNRAADEFLAEDADKTLDELSETGSDKLEEVMGEDFEEKITYLFENNDEQTLRDILVNSPGELIKLMEDNAIEGLLQ